MILYVIDNKIGVVHLALRALASLLIEQPILLVYLPIAAVPKLLPTKSVTIQCMIGLNKMLASCMFSVSE
jgi:hypothetical protein